MTGFVDDAKIDVPCGNCGRKAQKTIGWLKAHKQFTCTCGTVIELKTDKFKADMAKVDTQLKKLGDAISKLGKRR